MTSHPSIIVADDDRSVRMVIVHALSKQGYQVVSASTVAAMWDLLQTTKANLLITDIGFPDGDALELLPRIQEKHPDLKIIMMSARANLLTAIRAQQEKLFDYLPKPFELKALLATVENAFLMQENTAQQLEKTVPPQQISPTLMGKSPAMQLTFKMMARYAGQSEPVLLQSEQGMNKMDIVQTMLEMSGMSGLQLIHINLEEIAEDKQFEKLFGTGGAVEKASGGALFLNNIELLSSDAQTHFVHLLGFQSRFSSDMPKRLFSGTATYLKLAVEQGVFREDLHNMIASISLRIPPLRDRKQDIVTLAQHFCSELNDISGVYKSLHPASFTILQNHEWRNNLSELKNVIKLSYENYDDTYVTAEHIETEIRNVEIQAAASQNRSLSADMARHIEHYFQSLNGSSPAPDLYQHIIEEVEKPLLVSTLRYTQGNQIKAAEILGLNRNTLRKKIRALKLSSKRADYR